MLRPLCIGIGFVLAAASAQAQTFRTLHSFAEAEEGSSTAAPLMQASDGLFYGVNRFYGPLGSGTLFRMTSNGTLTVMHAFTGGAGGGRPESQLVQGADGHLYGTTTEGGLYNRGVAFRFTLAGAYTVLHAFGATPDAGTVPGDLIRGAGADFYGTTCGGGANNHGTVFRMTNAGEVTTLYSFTDGPGGRCPYGLLVATDGNLYGTAQGGNYSDGMVFRLTPGGTLTNIRDFSRFLPEGSNPGPLLQSKFDGHLYGVTRGSGGFFDYTSGSVFRLTTAGALQILHTFGGNQYTGFHPRDRLLEGTDGHFYGVTEHGGYPYSYYTSTGTVFRVTRDGVHTDLRRLNADFDGMHPLTSLIQSNDGHLYGTTSSGGFYFWGTIFRLETYICTNTIAASYAPAFESLNLTFGFQSAGPGTWTVWALTTTGLTHLWSLPVGPSALPAGFGTGFDLPPMGPILFITWLNVPGFGSCGGLSSVDTGTSAARTSIR